MNKADLVDRIASGTGLTKVETEAVIEGFMSSVIDAVRGDERVELRGFGSFTAQKRDARPVRNPNTGEMMEIPARYVPSFRPAKEFREQVETHLDVDSSD